MPGYRREFEDGRYGQMHLRIVEPEITQKTPLICLHMLPQSGRNFEQFIQSIGTDRIVIAPDFPGYGESCAPNDPISATEYAEAIWELVCELSLIDKFGQIDLFGVHAGSKLAVELAYQHPEQIRKLILVSAAVLLPEEIEKMKGSLSHIPLDEKGSRYRLFWDLLIRNKGPDTSLEMVAKGFAEMIRGGEKYSWGHRAVFEYNSIFPERLQALSHSVLLLNPEDDLYEMTPRSQAYLRNGEMVDLPGWGLGYMDTRTDELAGITREFLNRRSESLAAAE